LLHTIISSFLEGNTLELEMVAEARGDSKAKTRISKGNWSGLGSRGWGGVDIFWNNTLVEKFDCM